MHSGSACMMIGFRSDHACIMHKSETDWMHARGQPASARAWPAASGQLAGWRIDFWGTQSRHDMAPIAAHKVISACMRVQATRATARCPAHTYRRVTRRGAYRAVRIAESGRSAASPSCCAPSPLPNKAAPNSAS
jgi:hypothetical protein